MSKSKIPTATFVKWFDGKKNKLEHFVNSAITQIAEFSTEEDRTISYGYGSSDINNTYISVATDNDSIYVECSLLPRTEQGYSIGMQKSDAAFKQLKKMTPGTESQEFWKQWNGKDRSCFFRTFEDKQDVTKFTCDFVRVACQKIISTIPLDENAKTTASKISKANKAKEKLYKEAQAIFGNEVGSSALEKVKESIDRQFNERTSEAMDKSTKRTEKGHSSEEDETRASKKSARSIVEAGPQRRGRTLSQ